jgi:hypothetical protein
MKIFLLVFSLLFISNWADGQGWRYQYGGNEREDISEIIPLADGGFLAVGSTSSFGVNTDMYVVRTDSLGQLLWQRNIGTGAFETAADAAEGPSGEIYVTGSVDYINGDDVYLAKLSPGGNILWTKTFGGALSDNSVSIVPVGNDFVIAGTTTSNGIQNTPDMFLLKADSSGNQVWYKTYGSLVTETALAMTKVHDGGFLICGQYQTASVYAGYAVRTDADGDSIWKKIYLIGGAPYVGYNSCAELKGDSVFAMTARGGAVYGTYYATRIGLNGNVINHFTQSGYLKYNTDVYATSDGGFVANGYPFTKFSPLATVEWETGVLDGYSVIQNPDDSYCTAGIDISIHPPPNSYSDYDAKIERTSSNGTPLLTGLLPITLSGPSPFCEGDTMILSVPPGFDNYLWYRYESYQYFYGIQNSNNDTLVVDTIGSYFCVMQIGDQYFSSQIGTINYRIPPFTQLNYSGPVSICLADTSITFSVNQIISTSYQWYLNGNPITGGSYYSYTPQSSGDYYVTATNLCGSAISDTINFNATGIPLLTINPDTSYIEFVYPPGVDCGTTTLTLPYSNKYTYAWYHNGNAIPGTQYSNLVSGIGSYHAVISNSCQSTTTAPVYVLADTVTYPLSINGPLVGCGPETTTLTLPACSTCTYKWFRNNVQLTGSISSYYSPNSSGSYYCEIRRNCSGNIVVYTTDSVSYLYEKHTRKTVNFAGQFPAFCADSLQLSVYVSFGAAYQWFRDSILIPGADSNVYFATATGIYYVEEYFMGCDTVRSYNRFIRYGLPQGVITSETTVFCNGNGTIEVELITNDPLYSNYGTAQWTLNGVAIPNASYDSYYASQAGVYACVIANICGSVTTNSINLVDGFNNIQVTSDGNNICAGDTFHLTATSGPGYTYQWYNSNIIIGATNSVYAGTDPGYHYVNVNDGTCTYYAAGFNIVIQTLPQSSLLAVTSPSLCVNDSVEIAAGIRYDFLYEWYHDNLLLQGENNSSVYAAQPGAYTCVYTDSIGCRFTSAPLNISDNEVGNFAIYTNTGNNVACNGDSIEMFAGYTGVSYQWYLNLNPIAGANSYSLQTDSAGLYSVVVTSASGCTGIHSMSVISSQPYQITPTVIPSSCGYSSGSISVSAYGNYYLWSTGATTSTISNLVPGNYTLTLTDVSTTCPSTFTITVPDTSQQLPIITGDTAICAGDSTVLTVSNNAYFAYTWSDGSTTSSISVQASGQYWVIVSDSAGTCTGSDTINVTVSALPVMTLSANGPLGICQGDTVDLTAPPGLTSYKWLKNNIYTGYTQQTYGAFNTGSYRCVGTNAAGCRDTSTAMRVRIVCIPIGPNHSKFDNSQPHSDMLVEAYPNPSTGNFNIKVNCSNDTEIRYNLFNPTGKKVLSGLTASDQFIIDGALFSPGVYNMEIICGTNKKHVRLIILQQ